ncbi:hypothetical protein SLEP1_g26985 [Rubroshorea leprosula]|uniref:Uncharacterized protein n=1 Tax=Rubroshorea leprosula TaxID=152421 RepID=A0AAV5JY71_9ROSI|nr:hypothetical protein SLEP1_g26985 [Rubroshorea leprosula]
MTKPSIKDLMVALGGKLSLTAEEDVGLDLDTDKQNNQLIGMAKWCLVNMLLTRSRYNLEALKNTLASVLVEGPWHFVNHTMVLKEAHGAETGLPIGVGISRLIDVNARDRDT